MSKFWKILRILWHALVTFAASLAPLMFLVGVIAGIDQYGAQKRLIEKLETYGKTTDATVSYIDDEYGRAGVDYLDSNGEQGFGTLDLRYYSPEVQKTIQPGAIIRIIYIDALVSEREKTVLAEHYDDVRNYPRVPTDILWVLFISWLIIAIKPQFVFLGMIEFEKLLKSALPGVG